MPANSQNHKTITFAKNSSAKNDNFADLSNSNDRFTLDVLANDRGGHAKVLWSLDEGRGRWNEPSDLLTRDNIGNINYSQLGAQISITQDGKVSYVITPELQSKLKDLVVDEELTDTFIYAMKVGQGNSPLHWAKATVTLNGMNHAPELTGTTAVLPEGAQNTDYTILASDLLKGFTDADHNELSVDNLTVTHGALTQTADGWIFTPENNFTGEVELSYDIVDGHGGSLGTTSKFMLAPNLSDELAPTLVSSEPADDSSAVPVNNNLVLHFDEVVAPGTGNIVITNGTDTRLIAVNDSNQVTFNGGKVSSGSEVSSGSKVTINPSTNLVPNTTYHVEMASGVITDTSGNPYAGIHDSTTLNFTTIPDTDAPLLTWSNLFDNGIFKIDDDMFLTFNEEIMAGTGNIVITDGTDTRTIAINDPSQVTISNSKNGGTLFINPSADLVLNSNYHIEIPKGVITDTSGNDWEGINDDTTLNFTTIDSSPLLTGSNPIEIDDGIYFQINQDIELYFDEAVKPGSSGNIVISNGSDTRAIAINDASQVSFDNSNRIVINPTVDLLPGANYNIKIDSGAITDLDGNPYAGISDDTTLNFTTTTDDPSLIGSSPADDMVDVPMDSDVVLYFSEPISSGAGNFVITNGTDTRVIAANDNNQVTFNGSKVTINPSTDLVPNTTYHIEMGSGVITDLAGNPYAGISDETTLNFTTSDHAGPYPVDPTEPLFLHPMAPSIIGVADDSNLVIIS